MRCFFVDSGPWCGRWGTLPSRALRRVAAASPPSIMLTRSLVSVCLGLLAANASAQSCAALPVLGTGAPGTSLTFDLNATDAGAFAVLAVGQTQGTTTIPMGPLGSLTLGLATPFIPIPLGMTNASGDISRTIAIPAGVTWGIDLFGQG